MQRCLSVERRLRQAAVILSLLGFLLEGAATGHAVSLPGQIIVDPNHSSWLVYDKDTDGDGRLDPFFMAGPGDPEDFLYRGTRNADGTRSGDQLSLITTLQGTGANSIYLQIIRSHGGDGDATHNPFVNNDPAQGLNAKVLDQWDTWFTAMDDNGIVIFLFFYDDSARIWNTGDSVGPEERSFIQAIVNRFEHHRHLIWVVAEEYAEVLTPARVSNIAADIRAADDHAHVIAVHKNDGLDFSELANDPAIDQFAIQYNVATAAELHAGMLTAWNGAAGRYHLTMSEAADHGTGVTARHKNWATAMGGASVMVLGWDIASTPVSDLQDAGRLRTFMESTRFNEMAPHDELAFGGTQYVLANPGSAYIAYASNLSGNLGLKGMTAGTYDLTWFDAVNGTTVTQMNVNVASGDQVWTKPSSIGNELALSIKRTGTVAPMTVFPGATWQTKPPAEVGLDSAKLDAFRNDVQGRGCVVRYGYQVYCWGDSTTSGDVASAAKPFYSYFLFKAVERGRVASVDTNATVYEPCLNNLNASLGFKDRNITFRHLANQTSVYGVREAAGTAFDYSDWQMALFWDTLFVKVYGSSYSTVDSAVLRPLLATPLQFQDNPTFMAFGTGDRPGRLAISPRDFARFGLLYLRKGNWNGAQIISEASATMAVTNPVTVPRTTNQSAEMCSGQRSIGGGNDQTHHDNSYSWLWWINGTTSSGARLWPDAPGDTFGAFGHGGFRAMYVMPSLDLVISYNDTTTTDWNRVNEGMRLLVAAVTSGASPDTIPPSVPANLTATSVSSSRINLAWTVSTDTGGSGLSGYRLERCQGSGCSSFTQIAAPSTSSYSDSGLAASTMYVYRVRATDGAGNLSSYSTTASATTLAGSSLTITHLTVGSGRTYQVVDQGLFLGALTYIDRSFTMASIPSLLQGATYLQTANDDKASTGTSFLTFSVNQAATIYVAHDDRIVSTPAWLAAFPDTGSDLVTTDATLSLFAKDVSAGPVTLGGNEGGCCSMYAVVVAPRSSPPALRGDLDGNGTVDLDDLRRMIFMLVGTVPPDLAKADLDGDGQLTLADLQALVRVLVGVP